MRHVLGTSLVVLSELAAAQDPAPGWMAYAKGTIPDGTERITKLEMTWTVPQEAGRSLAFYSPWFGMDPVDNLNLLQPVNPFSGTSKQWTMYTEYFQFLPPWNHNSPSHSVKGGQTLHGLIEYDADHDHYTLTNSIVETGVTSSQVVKCQAGKKFHIPYVVFEKKWPCHAYPPEGKVTFHDIVVECDGHDCTHQVEWEAKVRDAHCNMRAEIDSEHNEISILWDTTMSSSVDNFTHEEMIALNADGWGAEFAKSALEELKVEEEFVAYQKRFNKQYTREETDARFNAFKANSLLIQQENAKNGDVRLGINQFSDMTWDDFSKTHLGLRVARTWGDETPHLGEHQYSGAPLPDSVDWTSNGAVTAVKDQKSCGSCWAFSTTGSLEGALEIASGTLVPLSEQQFVDCASQFGNAGCGGGLMDEAFDYAKQAAICTEESYPYMASDGSCKASSCTPAIQAGGVTGYKDVAKEDVNALMEAVAQQPVSVGIEADGYYFQHYQSGVLSQPCGENLDHGVLLVGYGSDNGQDYWKVKNSWGPSWGEGGYVRFGRGGQEPPWGECGIQEQASYPIVAALQDAVV